LAQRGSAIEPEVRAALSATKSTEARRRLEELLEGLRRGLSGEALRRSRAVRTLQLMDTPDAAKLLRTLEKLR
jgi:hypothetical protein